MEDDFTVGLWHKRLAHMSEKDLAILAKKKSSLWNEKCKFEKMYSLLSRVT
ncbi:hypothetical protein Patl1_37273 [Pistacia atlantica]|nr:hypothetical protein Patl1_37273 [Pistacia atlantica]